MTGRRYRRMSIGNNKETTTTETSNPSTINSLGSALSAVLRRSAPAFALCAVAATPQAYAQDAAASDELEEIVVTGIRQSLQSSQDIKKNAEVFVDSVTAEDIGALPDRSVTEALQRIPGVSINRFAGSNDPDHFSIEGSGVVVRGLNQVRSELNGRDTFSANNGRFLSFADVPPELMGGVDVFKNQSADMIEGGLAGTVNLRTRVPFDSPGQTIAFSAEANYGDFAEEWAPTGSALYTNRWDTDAGEFGILLNGVYSELKSRSDGVQASSFRLRSDVAPGLDLWVPEGAAVRTQDYNRERIGAALAAQWESPDDTMLATFQFLRSDAKTAWAEHAIEVATDVVGDSAFQLVPGTDIGWNNENIFTHGTLTAPTGWRDDERQDWHGPNDREERTPFWGLQSNNIARSVDQQYVTSDYGLNFKWTPNEQWAFNFDAQFVDSTVENLDMTIWGSTFQNATIDLRGDIPKVTFLPPSQTGPVTQCAAIADDCPTYFNAPNDSFQNPYNSFWRAAMDHIEDSEGDEKAFRFDIDRNFEHDWVRGVRFGGRYADREQTTRYTTYNWGALSEIWGSGGPVWFNDPVDGVPDLNGFPGTVGEPSATRTQVFTFDNFMRGDSPVPAFVPFYAGDLVGGDAYRRASEFALAIADEWRPKIDPATGVPNNNWVPLADPRRGDVIPGTPFLPREINVTDEETQALYLMMKFGTEPADGPSISGNVGVRWVRTDFAADGTVGFPLPSDLDPEEDCFPDPAAPPGTVFDPTPFCEDLTPEQRAAARRFATGQTLSEVVEHSYDNFLPSFNLKIGLSEDMLFRFGFSKALARPELGLTRHYFTMTPRVVDDDWLGFEAQTGNAFLKPTRSTQYDGSFEWYFADVGSFTLSLFYKELTDVLTNGFEVVPMTAGGETFDILVTRPINSDETGIVRGYEVGYQQVYDMLPGFWGGFGIQANYTYIHSKGVSQANLSPTASNGAVGPEPNVDTSLLPLQGLSRDNVNFTLFYERGPISTRLAYNWRSRFLLTIRDVITPFAPIFNEETGQLDGSFFYTINENVKVGIQGVNLLNEVTKTSQVLNDELLTAGRSWFMNDRRYSLVARITF